MVLIYLIFRGRVKKVVAISLHGRGVAGKYFVHLLGITKKGHVLHFEHALEDRYNSYAPFWFLGKIKGISKNKQQKMLKASGRKVLWTTDQFWWFVPYILLIAFLTSIILYILAYPLFIWISIKGIVEALRAR